jgi:FtsP/CotA-like multicopper oxidase with cupredoxin domain
VIAKPQSTLAATGTPPSIQRSTTISRRTFLLGLAAGWLALAAPWRAARAQSEPKRVIDVRIEHRKVVSPSGPIRITEGDSVELHWTCDEETKLHLHGYDVEVEVGPGKPGVMAIEARATGRFPVSSHGWGSGGHSHDTLIYLEVYPR